MMDNLSRRKKRCSIERNFHRYEGEIQIYLLFFLRFVRTPLIELSEHAQLQNSVDASNKP